MKKDKPVKPLPSLAEVFPDPLTRAYLLALVHNENLLANMKENNR